MEKNRDSTILNEKDHINSHLNTLNDSTAKQKSDAPRESQINRVPSKWLTSLFNPTPEKTRRKSQSNTIDVWLNKTAEGKEHKLSSKSSERSSEDRHEKENCNNEDKQIGFERSSLPAKSSSAPMKKTLSEEKSGTKSNERSSTWNKDKREKENWNNENKQTEFERNLPTKSSSASIKEIPSDTLSRTETNNSTKHKLKVASQHKGSSSSDNKSSRKIFEKKCKTAKVESQSHQRKLDSYLNNEDKHNKLKSDNKKLQSSTDRPSSHSTTRKEDDHKKRSSNENKQNKHESDNKKLQLSTDRPSSCSTTRKENGHKERSSNNENKQNKHKSDNRKLQSSTSCSSDRTTTRKKDSYGESFSNNEDKQNKRKDDNKKSDLQRSTSCPSNHGTSRIKDSHKESFNNNKEPTRKNDRSKTEVEKSLRKQENLKPSPDSPIKKKYKRIKSTAVKKDIVWLSKNGGNKDKHKDGSKTKYDELPVKTSSNRSRENLDEKNKSSKRSRSNTKSKGSVKKSFDEHESCDKKYKSSTKKSRSKTGQDHGIRLPLRVQEKLDSYLIKNLKPNNKRKFTRTDSNESCDLPSFKSSTKSAKRPKKDEFFKKYGMSIPSVEEILKDQRELEKYKQKIQSFQDIDEKSFELPFSVKDLNRTQETHGEVLGCKHLSMDEITASFKKNLKHISAIFHGETFNERHEKYFNNTNSYTLTVKDLCYNTSMIVFNFDQKEHMITLLKNEFDPDDKWTPYFFQVLLPELCMNIFMDAHGMAYDEAVKYLDTRPIVDD